MSEITIESKMRMALTTAQREAKRNPGEALPNGAIIISHSQEIRRTDCHVEYIVLALVHSAFQPYVTWRRSIGIEQKADGSYGSGVDYCFSGEYCRDIEDAVASFKERTYEEAV